MDIIDTKHLKRTIDLLNKTAEEYAAQAAKYEKVGLESLQGWYEGRGTALAMAAKWIETDLNVYADDIAHLIGDAQ